MAEVLQIRSNGQITLPTSIRRQADLKEGDLLEVTIEADGSLRLIPKMAIDRSQAYFWTTRWQQGKARPSRIYRLANSKTMEAWMNSSSRLKMRPRRNDLSPHRTLSPGLHGAASRNSAQNIISFRLIQRRIPQPVAENQGLRRYLGRSYRPTISLYFSLGERFLDRRNYLCLSKHRQPR